MIPTAEEKEEIKARKAELALRKKQNAADDASSDNGDSPVDKVVFEMLPPHSKQAAAAGGAQYGYYGPQSPSPFTPRTQAFNALERKLPLRD